MNAQNYDVLVIGAGPAGYHAAIRCAQLGLQTACIDKSLTVDSQPVLGGTCLNWGCIPSKALLDISHKYMEAKHQFAELGLISSGLKLDLVKTMAYKDKVVKGLTAGIKSLFSGNKVKHLTGTGILLGAQQVEFKSHNGKKVILSAKHIILAPGSVPMQIPSVPIDSDKIVDSTGALEFVTVPKRLGIIGAGAIGLELGSVWRRFGSDVVIMEALEEFLPMTDKQISREAMRLFSAQGLDIRMGARVSQCQLKKGKVVLHYTDKKGQNEEIFDKLIVAIGRMAWTKNLLADGCGIDTDEQGFIPVNDVCETVLPGVYAIGDAVRGPSLAHKGMEEGTMVAERIMGKAPLVNYDLIPGVIYTWPEMAWVGATEENLRAKGLEYNKSSFSFAASGRALAGGNTQGMVKMLADKKTDQILGVHILGPQASELIASIVIAMEFGACSEDLALTMFAHPTLAEAIHESALGIHGHAIHVVNRKKQETRKT